MSHVELLTDSYRSHHNYSKHTYTTFKLILMRAEDNQRWRQILKYQWQQKLGERDRDETHQFWPVCFLSMGNLATFLDFSFIFLFFSPTFLSPQIPHSPLPLPVENTMLSSRWHTLKLMVIFMLCHLGDNIPCEGVKIVIFYFSFFCRIFCCMDDEPV